MLDREQDLVAGSGGGGDQEPRRHRDQARRYDDHDEERAEEERRETRHRDADADGDPGEVDDVLQVEEGAGRPGEGLRAKTDHREPGEGGAHGEHVFDGDPGNPEPPQDQNEGGHGRGGAEPGDTEPVVDDGEIVAGTSGMRRGDRRGIGHVAR